MLLEKTGIFSQGQSLVGAISVQSTNDIDLKTSPFRDIAIGVKPMYIVSQLTASLTGAGVTVAVTLQQSASAGAGTYTALQSLTTFPALTTTGSAAAYDVVVISPLNITQEYLSIVYTMSGLLVTGAVTTILTPDPQLWLAYPKNYTISTR